MRECDIFDVDGIGDLYATARARAILNGGEDLLNDEERALKSRLLAFEQHFLTCDACLSRVREYQDLRAVFQRLGETGAHASRPHPGTGSPFRWLAAAAAILLVSTVALSFQVARLSRRAGRSAGPRAVAGVYDLSPESPAHRAGTQDRTVVSSADASFVLAVEVSRVESDGRRYVVRVVDAGGDALYRDDDAPVAASGHLYVQIGPRFLAPGEYSLEVRALDRRGGEVLATATFPFQVEGNAEGP